MGLDFRSNSRVSVFQPEQAEICERWSEFEEKFRTLQKESAKLKQVAATGDRATIKAQFGKTAKACKGYHKNFREEKESLGCS